MPFRVLNVIHLLKFTWFGSASVVFSPTRICYSPGTFLLPLSIQCFSRNIPKFFLYSILVVWCEQLILFAQCLTSFSLETVPDWRLGLSSLSDSNGILLGLPSSYHASPRQFSMCSGGYGEFPCVMDIRSINISLLAKAFSNWVLAYLSRFKFITSCFCFCFVFKYVSGCCTGKIQV